MGKLEDLVMAWIFKKYIWGGGGGVLIDWIRLAVTDFGTGTAWSLNVTPKFLYSFRPFNILLSLPIYAVCKPVNY